MSNNYQRLLNDYYRGKDIHPEDFNCKKQTTCRRYAYLGNMTETKMSMVGSRYGEMYPKIVIVSLDPPSGEKKDNTPKRWTFKTPEQRTTEYVAAIHEKDDYSMDRPNPHWAMTQIIVKDLLTLWGYEAQPYAAVVLEKFLGHPIENVSAYFAHVNVAKCSMNNPNQNQASPAVHNTCSNAYLRDELIILEPDILITQGVTTNKILGKMLVGRESLLIDLPKTETITLGGKQILWMPMHHPTGQLDKVRDFWHIYLRAAKVWAKKIT